MSLFTKKKNSVVDNVVMQSAAIQKASRGYYNTENFIIDVDRARTIYGFSNFALNKSSEEIRDTWISVSEDFRKKRT
ncbi:hypothetical protein H2Y56_00495 [Pectobacterium aroidearum]|uniref:Uncharacterized protein n=1 Tax=Pectobacterium aroidearum TaxID=1201031 RepID=A0ABR5Z7N9_9GAMM|nr:MULTISPECIES: hypothetical protein [Pectobacterium]MBA5197802.1 hypothetical protein [Pectobacterium aroidearum]MBA5230595.1 hypothetical protein [Pectobacterium aroidearum]GKV95433.1 hypothetical protein PEC301645_28800 [Pectobacterium carotovorum subsp. carotovorum]